MSDAPRARPSAHGPESLLGSVLGLAACAVPVVLAARDPGWLLAAPATVAVVAVVLVGVPGCRRFGLGLLAGAAAFGLSVLVLLVLFLVTLSASGPPVPPPPG